jgi:uncharacterized membrane protein (DUF373 family)
MIKNEEYYKQNIVILIALANLFGFFLVAIVTAAYSLIKNEDMDLMLNKVFAIFIDYTWVVVWSNYHYLCVKFILYLK